MVAALDIALSQWSFEYIEVECLVFYFPPNCLNLICCLTPDSSGGSVHDHQEHQHSVHPAVGHSAQAGDEALESGRHRGHDQLGAGHVRLQEYGLCTGRLRHGPVCVFPQW